MIPAWCFYRGENGTNKHATGRSQSDCGGKTGINEKQQEKKEEKVRTLDKKETEESCRRF